MITVSNMTELMLNTIYGIHVVKWYIYRINNVRSPNNIHEIIPKQPTILQNINTNMLDARC